MNYNAVLSVENITDASDVGNEPVTLSEVKEYLRLEGYIDTDESTADTLSDFDFDDDLINDMITASRQMMERHTNLSLIPKRLEVVVTNLCGMIELPYGPVDDIVSLYDEEGDEIEADDYTIIGNTWKFLKEPCYENMTITYDAGYVTLPASMKLDLLRLIAYMYENRGDDPAIDRFSFQIAIKYARPVI